jgi:hypothetical protein
MPTWFRRNIYKKHLRPVAGKKLLKFASKTLQKLSDLLRRSYNCHC